MVKKSQISELTLPWESLNRPIPNCIAGVNGQLKTPRGPFAPLRRLVHLMFILFLHMIVHSFYDRSYRGACEEPADFWNRILFTFEDWGPTFVKVGQLLSQRPELPRPLTDQLVKLLDWGPMLSPELVRERVEGEIGPIGEVFAKFNDLPISSASLAQVHEAELNSNERVAVKVRKPGLIERINLDLGILGILCKSIAALPELLFRPFPGNQKFVGEFIKTFEVALEREVDFEQEAKFIEKFEEVWEENDDILVPKVYWDYTTEKVLVMEFMEGLQFNWVEDHEGWREAGVDPRKVFAHLTQAGMESLISGIVHGDTHPANLKGTSDGKIVILDFGMSQELEDEELDVVMELISSLRWGEIDEVVELMLGEMAEVPDHVSVDEVVENARSIFGKYTEEDGAGIPVLERSVWKEDGDPRETVIDDIIHLGLEHNVSIRHRFVLVLKSIAYLIQDGKKLWPGAPFFDMVVPYIYSFNKYRKIDPEGGVQIDKEAAVEEAVTDAKIFERQEFSD